MLISTSTTWTLWFANDMELTASDVATLLVGTVAALVANYPFADKELTASGVATLLLGTVAALANYLFAENGSGSITTRTLYGTAAPSVCGHLCYTHTWHSIDGAVNKQDLGPLYFWSAYRMSEVLNFQTMSAVSMHSSSSSRTERRW